MSHLMTDVTFETYAKERFIAQERNTMTQAQEQGGSLGLSRLRGILIVFILPFMNPIHASLPTVRCIFRMKKEMLASETMKESST